MISYRNSGYVWYVNIISQKWNKNVKNKTIILKDSTKSNSMYINNNNIHLVSLTCIKCLKEKKLN